MVIKVIRPDILPVIKADLKLIYRLARWVPRLLPDGRRLRPTEVVREYEKTLIDELNLLRESANAIQLRRNFEDSPMLYIPEVYPDYCSEGMMVMERIYGIPVSDVAALEKNGTNMKLLAERGVQVFFTQVFRDSFFHADMHPGNIFVSYEHPENPKYIGIDCGIVGSLNKEDKRYLAETLSPSLIATIAKWQSYTSILAGCHQIPTLKSSNLPFVRSVNLSLRNRWPKFRLDMYC